MSPGLLKYCFSGSHAHDLVLPDDVTFTSKHAAMEPNLVTHSLSATHVMLNDASSGQTTHIQELKFMNIS